MDGMGCETFLCKPRAARDKIFRNLFLKENEKPTPIQIWFTYYIYRIIYVYTWNYTTFIIINVNSSLV